MCRLSIAFLGLLAAVGTGLAQSPYAVAGITDAGRVEGFLAELQRASRSDDRNAMASLIRYPVTVMIDGLRVPFANPATLLERYDAIFTPTMQETIARAVGVDQPQTGRVPLTANPDGLVLGTNAILIKQMDGQLKITSIVVPRPDSDAAAPVARRQEPRRVAIRIGPRPTQLSGALAAGVADAYVVWIPKGKVLEVRLERVQNRAARVRVMHAGTGAPLNPRAADGARVVTGRALESADYRIYVERTQSDEPTPLPYVLSFSLR